MLPLDPQPIELSNDLDENPWDIKRLTLSLGGGPDKERFIVFEIFNKDSFNIYEGDGHGKDPKWHYEEIDLKAARLLRDFLNYAVK